MRVLIGWVYANTGSVLHAQIMHASSTGFLATLSPSHVTAGQEAFWYAVYAGVLWIAVAVVVTIYSTQLTRRHASLAASSARTLRIDTGTA
jgi:hypothetical protein